MEMYTCLSWCLKMENVRLYFWMARIFKRLFRRPHWNLVPKLVMATCVEVVKLVPFDKLIALWHETIFDAQENINCLRYDHIMILLAFTQTALLICLYRTL